MSRGCFLPESCLTSTASPEGVFLSPLSLWWCTFCALDSWISTASPEGVFPSPFLPCQFGRSRNRFLSWFGPARLAASRDPTWPETTMDLNSSISYLHNLCGLKDSSKPKYTVYLSHLFRICKLFRVTSSEQYQSSLFGDIASHNVWLSCRWWSEFTDEIFIFYKIWLSCRRFSPSFFFSSPLLQVTLDYTLDWTVPTHRCMWILLCHLSSACSSSFPINFVCILHARAKMCACAGVPRSLWHTHTRLFLLHWHAWFLHWLYLAALVSGIIIPEYEQKLSNRICFSGTVKSGILRSGVIIPELSSYLTVHACNQACSVRYCFFFQ